MARIREVRSTSTLVWKTPDDFRETALFFIKNGYYCPHPWGSDKWFQFWQSERDKCINGVKIGNARITGEHYFYLNFCPIRKVDNTNSKKAVKIVSFPDFWDGDYEYFWYREIARNGIDVKEYKKLNLRAKVKEEYLNGGYNFIIGKSRRKGYSFKGGSIGAYNFFFRPDSITGYGAEDTKFLYPKGIFSMVKSYIDFNNDNCAWRTPSDVVNTSTHIRNSYVVFQNGVKIEKGMMSEVLALSFNNNPDAFRGKDLYDLFIEEAGAFGSPGLLQKCYASSEDCVQAGSIKTGMITVFGTSGSLDSGTVDYADMFMRPGAFGMLPFMNTWDKDAEQQECGFFHPVNMNMEGFYDKNGNSDFEGAKEYELAEREKLIKKGATSIQISNRLQEKPLCPGEAFGSASTNQFPVLELNEQLRKVKALNLQTIKGVPCTLHYEGNEVIAKPILEGAKPITSYMNVPDDTRGCVVIYEQPVGNCPKGLYKIGYDPVRQNHGSSLAAIIVYKSTHAIMSTKEVIVAEYIGRMEDNDDMDRIAEMLAVFYNTTVMHENEVTSVKNYFRQRRLLHLLALQPDEVISNNIKKSKVARIYGCHMTDKLKDAGERYIKDWLLKVIDYDEDGNPIRAYERIYSIRLLEELINYNRKGNFDLISALIMCMFQVQEETLGKVYGEEKDNQMSTARRLFDMIKDLNRRR